MDYFCDFWAKVAINPDKWTSENKRTFFLKRRSVWDKTSGGSRNFLLLFFFWRLFRIIAKKTIKMDALAIIDKYYPEDNELKRILVTHSRSVADTALWIADTHPELELDKQFLEEAALLHDIGVFLTDAPGIHCYGTHPYICHGYLGSQLLQQEGFLRHALVCERHTGA